VEQFSARQYFAKLKIGDLFYKRLINAIRAGENSVMQNVAVEEVISDDKWIKEIEALLFSVEQIVRNPKRSIIEENIVVQIEKARKINAQSIRHLSAHSNYVRSVDEDGTVHPAKILTSIMEEDLLIYENRFVYTLIQRLLSFLEQKYNYMSAFSEKTEVVRLNFKSDFNFNDLKVEYGLNMKVKKPLSESKARDLSELIGKVELLKKRVYALTGSEFYKKLSKTNPLKPPISKTNIIKMNVDYNNSYKLWLFISSFVNTGYSVTVSDMELPVEQDYYDDLVYLAATALRTMIENNVIKNFSDEDYEEQADKEYIIERDVNFIPDFQGFEPKETVPEDYLNDYYFEKIKEALKIEDLKNYNQEKKDIFYSFAAFYKQLSKINNNIFEELLNYDYRKTQSANADKEKRKEDELRYRKEVYRRNHMLARLKKIDLANTLRKDAYLLARIKKLEQQLKDIKAKNKNIKSVPKKNKTRTEIVEQIIKNDNKISRDVLKEAEKEISENKGSTNNNSTGAQDN
jgi:hypothetical protein